MPQWRPPDPSDPARLLALVAYQRKIINFIAKNSDTLNGFVEQALHNPALIRVIELIAAGA
jgi:hypothetical protein